MSESVVVVAMCKDEVDVVVPWLDHLFSQDIDHVHVADNMSTDGTYEMLCEYQVHQSRLTVARDTEVAYYQAEKTSRMADMMTEQYGAHWVVPIDLDELWFSWSGTVGETLRRVNSNVKVVEAKLINYFPTGGDPEESNPFKRIVYRQPEAQRLVKVAARWQPGSLFWMGNHDVTLRRPGDRETLLEIAHFPYRSQEQFIRKSLNGAAAYRAATDLPAGAGEHWKGYGEAYERGGEQALIDWYNTWFHFESPNDADPPLVWDPARWCKRGD